MRRGCSLARHEKLRRESCRNHRRLLAFDSPETDWAYQTINLAVRDPELPREAHKAGALCFGTDKPDKGKAVPPQRGSGNIEIKWVGVGHYHQKGIAWRISKLAIEGGRADHDGVLRNVLRKLFGAAVDPTHYKWQGRERKHDSAPDMACAEQQHWRDRFAEALPECRLVERPALPKPLLRRVLDDNADDPAARVEAVVGFELAGGLRSLQPAHRRQIGSVECLNQRPDHAAAALAEIRTEWPVAKLRLAATGREQRAGLRDGFVFEPAAADRAEEAAVRLQNDAGAALARDRTGGIDDAEQAGTAVPVDRLTDSRPDLGHLTRSRRSGPRPAPVARPRPPDRSR